MTLRGILTEIITGNRGSMTPMVETSGLYAANLLIRELNERWSAIGQKQSKFTSLDDEVTYDDRYMGAFVAGLEYTLSKRGVMMQEAAITRDQFKEELTLVRFPEV